MAPHPISRRGLFGLAGAATGLVVLAACGDDSSETTSPGASGTAAADTFPLTIKHALGETVIEKKPERVATVAWANHEVPLALGVVPVGMSKATWGDDDGDGILPWVEEKLTELGGTAPVLFDETDGIDFEAVADTAPDVILAAYSGLTKEDYETLSKIAPTVAYPKIAWGTTVQDMITTNGSALGLSAASAALVSDLDAQTKTDFAKYPDLAGKTALWAFFDPTDLSQVGFYTIHDTRPGFLAAAGMKTPKFVTDESARSDAFYATISAEEVEKFADVDVIITYGTADGKTLTTAQAHPLLSKIPAVKRGSVALLPDSTPVAAIGNPTPLSIPWGLDKYFAAISTAAAKV